MTNLLNTHEWLEKVKDIIHNFSDLEYQKEAFKGSKRYWADTAEMIATALDDFFVTEWLEAFKNQLPTSLIQEMEVFLKDIQDLTEHDDEHQTHESVLLSPSWVKIRPLAASIYKQLLDLPSLDESKIPYSDLQQIMDVLEEREELENPS